MIKKTVVTGLVVLAATVVNAETVRSARNADLKIGDGAIRGQLMTTSGQTIGDLQVVLTDHTGQVVGRAMADHQGRFAVGPVRPGTYQLSVGDEAVQVRVWTSASAPPTAGSSLLFPVGTTVRGQILPNLLGGGRGLGVGVCVVGATIGTVIAVTSSDRHGS